MPLISSPGNESKPSSGRRARGVYSGNFPGATMMTNGSGAEIYYRTSNGSLEILGVAGNARGAPTDTLGVDYVAVFSPSQVQRPPTINFFDIRSQSIDCTISLPPLLPLPVDWPESLRSLFANYPGLDSLRLRFVYTLTDTVNAAGDLILPGMVAPTPVLRVRRSVGAVWYLEGHLGILDWMELYHARDNTWAEPVMGAPPPAAWISFLNTIKSQLDPRMESISGGGGLINNTNAAVPVDVYSFLSATDKEELAVGRVYIDPLFMNETLLSVTFKDFNPPPPSLRIARGATDLGVYWPVTATGWSLQVNGTLNPATWQAASGTPTQVGDELRFSVAPPFGAAKFYRLIPP